MWTMLWKLIPKKWLNFGGRRERIAFRAYCRAWAESERKAGRLSKQ